MLITVGIILGILATTAVIRFGNWHGKHQVTEALAYNVIVMTNVWQSLSENKQDEAEYQLVCEIRHSATEVAARAEMAGIENWQAVEISAASAERVRTTNPKLYESCAIPNT